MALLCKGIVLFGREAKHSIFGVILTVIVAAVTVFIQTKLGLVAQTQSWEAAAANVAPYVVILSLFIGWHAFRAPWKLYNEKALESANATRRQQEIQEEVRSAHEETKAQLQSIREELALERERNAGPKIVGRIIEGFFEDPESGSRIITTGRPDGSISKTADIFITLNVGLVNLRSRATTIRQCSLVIETPDGTLQPSRIFPLPTDLLLIRESAESRLFYRYGLTVPEKLTALEEAVGAHGLVDGVEVTGFVRFAIINANIDDQTIRSFKDSGAFRFRVEDSHGNTHEILRSPGPWEKSGEVIGRAL